MKTEGDEHLEEEPPALAPEAPTPLLVELHHPQSTSDNLIHDDVVEHGDDDDNNNNDDVHFDSMKSNEVINSHDHPHTAEGDGDGDYDDDVVVSTTNNNMSHPHPSSNPSTEYTVPLNDTDRTTTGSYRGFTYRNRRGMTGSSGAPEDDIQLARLVHRDLPFSQSRNRVNVHHNHGFKIFRLLRFDWFHVILRYPKGLCLLFLLSIWTFVIIIFAFIYVAVDSRQPAVDCGLGKIGSPIQFGQSFAFSLETSTTGTAWFI